MTVLRFGSGWRDRLGRERALLWTGDLSALLWDYGRDLEVVRRGLTDPDALRCRLLGWEDQVDAPDGPEWVTRQIHYWVPPRPRPDCVICQGEGWFAAEEAGELVAAPCSCGDEVF